MSFLVKKILFIYLLKLLYYYDIRMESIDVLPAEKIAFIAYNIGVYESVQKFGVLITSGKITSNMDVSKIAELLIESSAFYDAEMISSLMKDVDRREAIAEEIATKLYEKNVKDVRQLIDVMKLYSIQKTKTVDEVFQFREALLEHCC